MDVYPAPDSVFIIDEHAAVVAWVRPPKFWVLVERGEGIRDVEDELISFLAHFKGLEFLLTLGIRVG